MSTTEESSEDESLNIPIFEKPRPDPSETIFLEVNSKLDSIVDGETELENHKLSLESFLKKAFGNPNVSSYIQERQRSVKHLVDAEAEIKLLEVEDKVNFELCVAYYKIAEACKAQKTLKDTNQLLHELLNTYETLSQKINGKINGIRIWKPKAIAPVSAKNMCELLLTKMKAEIELLENAKPYFDEFNDDFHQLHEEATQCHSELLIKLDDIKNEIGRRIDDEDTRTILLEHAAYFEDFLTKWLKEIPNKLQNPWLTRH